MRGTDDGATSPPFSAGQYSRSGIRRYERIFGWGFTSPGGRATTLELCSRLKLRPGMHVLDIGSGLGGAAFLMARTFGVRVTGVDLSPEMIAIATECSRSNSIPGVEFRLEDIRLAAFPEDCFDVVWSRDSLLHIPEKDRLFCQVRKWVKPAGELLITDYACREPAASEEFREYVERSAYHLMSLENYGRVLVGAGFENVRVEDRTSDFAAILKREMEDLQAARDSFLQDFEEADYEYLIGRWQAKIRMCGTGDLKWGVFTSLPAGD